MNAVDELRKTLHPKLQATLEKRGFDDFSEIQLRAIPELIKGTNAIIIAPTGSGKTESALLPVFHNMLSKGMPISLWEEYSRPLSDR